MRISSNQMHQQAINAMLEQQAELSKVQQQVATGQKIDKPSEDPVAASKIVKLRDVLKLTDQYQSNINNARARLSLEEGTLGKIGDVYHRLRELAITANNAGQTSESRSFIAEEVDQLLDELVGLANSTDSNGEFLFSGSKGKFKPFAKNNHGGFDYHGDDTQQFIQIGPRRQIPVNDSGTDVFREIRDGNGAFTALESPNNRGTGVIDPGAVTGKYDFHTYAIVFDKPQSIDPNTPLTYTVIDAKGNIVSEPHQYEDGDAIEFRGVHTFVKGEPAAGDFFVIRPSHNKDIFSVVQDFAAELRSGNDTDRGQAHRNNRINRAITALDQGLGRVLEVRANVGARLNAMDSQQDINDAHKIQLKEILSQVEDLDYSKAVSDLNLKLTGLQASQKAFTRVQGITLFNFL
jgi:flagellar hook-associated protein 3 FlgL